MIGLKKVLDKFSISTVLPNVKHHSFKPKKSIQATQKALEMFSSYVPKEPSNYELVESYNAIYKAWKKEESLKNVAKIHLRRIPWLLFYRPLEHKRFLADDYNFLFHVFEEMELFNQSSRQIAALNEFCRVYPKQNREYWCNCLKKQLTKSNSPRTLALKKRINEFHILEINGPFLYAQEILMKNSISNLTQEVWFRKSLDHSMFLMASVIELLKILELHLSNGTINKNKIIEICSFLYPSGEANRFENLKSQVIETFLLPFQTQEPVSDLKEIIKNFLINNFGHPHLKLGNWTKVSKEAENVLLLWLTDETLEDFFQILDITAGDQWQYRRDFWNAILEKKLIRKAWVILGSRARTIASKLPQRAQSYGALIGASSDQSVLLMEIGPFIISEWSHSGKCRIWYFNSNNAPELFKTQYNSVNLRNNAYSDFIHYSSESCKWQNEISDFLRDQAGIKINRNEFFKRY